MARIPARRREKSLPNLVMRTILLASHFPRKVFEFGLDEFGPSDADGIGGARRGKDDFAAVGSGSGAAEHGGGADFGIAEHAEEFTEAGEAFLEFTAQNIEGGIAGRNAGAAVEENEAAGGSGEFIEDGGDLVGFVLDDAITIEAMAEGFDAFPEEFSVQVGIGSAGVGHGYEANANGAEVFGLFFMFGGAHRGGSLSEGKIGREAVPRV